MAVDLEALEVLLSQAFEETLSGVLLDIPTFVESFKSPNNHVFTKTADVSQMLVAFRGTWSEYKQRLQEQGVEVGAWSV